MPPLSAAYLSCWTVGVVLHLITTRTVQAAFGLTSKEVMFDAVLSANLSIVSNRDLCASFHLPSRQLRQCRRGHGVALTLVDAIRLSAQECQRQFLYERWDCSLDRTRINLLKRVFKETAFLYAISGASVVDAFARGCSTGRLRQCTCDDTTLDESSNRETWRWGGCGDNVPYGLRFANRFLFAGKKRRGAGSDLRAIVDRHNTAVGAKTVADLVTTVCKCHGVSGSCTSQTCWRKLASFTDVGDRLKTRFEVAVRIKNWNNQAKVLSTATAATGEGLRRPLVTMSTMEQQLGVDQDDLVFLHHPLNFCSRSRYSHGTAGRICLQGDNCETMCCGRGHNVQEVTVRSSCACRVVWCCYVNCKMCNYTEEIYTCK